MNSRISVLEVRLIASNGDQVGVLDTVKALELAKEEELDLVEIVPNQTPPVCRIMDYGKFRFDNQKKAHAAKKKQKQTQVKEMKFRPGTDQGDYDIKLRNLVRFLENGDKAKVTLRFRGREMAHQQLGMEMMKRVEADLIELAQVEQYPKMEGRQMIMVLAPRSKKK